MKRILLTMIGVLALSVSAFAQTNVIGMTKVGSAPANNGLYPMGLGALDNSGNMQWLQLDASKYLYVDVIAGNLAANQSVNVAQVNGVTTLTGAGATGTGSIRDTVAQDTTTIAGSAPGTAGTASANVVTVQGIASMTPLQGVGNVASGASDSGNPVKVGGIYNSTLPSLTTGQRGDAQLTSRATVLTATGLPAYTGLNAVTVTGAGTSLNMGSSYSSFALQVTITGNPTQTVVWIEGSLDGTNWAPTPLLKWDLTTPQVSADIVFVKDVPVQYVRANLKTLGGGSSPTVTAVLIAK